MNKETNLPPGFLSGLGRHLAHELNNPISSIMSAAFLLDDFAQTAAGGKIEVEQAKPFIESIREEAQKLKLIVEEFSRYASTETVLPQQVDLKEFLRARYKGRTDLGVELLVEYTGDNLQANADLGQIQNSLDALIEFAKQNNATHVTIRAERKENNILLQVCDDRTEGREADELLQVFDPIPVKRRQGLGLKLPLVKQIVTLHGGTVDSRALEDGRIMTEIMLPVQPSGLDRH